MTSSHWIQGSTVLLTGATGRVGSRVAQELLDAGARVRTIVLPDDPGVDRLLPAIEVVTGSLTEEGVVREAIAGVDALIHLAALMDWNPGAERRLWDANVTATFRLLDGLAQNAGQIERIIIVSSDEIYPALEVSGEITEDLPARPYSFYGLTKQLNEDLARFYHRAHGLPVVTVRFALTAAAEEIAQPYGWSGRLFFAAGLRRLLGGLGREDAVALIDGAVSEPETTLVLARDLDGRPYRFQFCDVRDLVQGIMLMATESSAVGEVFNLSGPEAFSYDDVVPRLAAVTGYDYVDLRLPGERFDVNTSTRKARTLLGYRPRNGIDEILAAIGEPGKVRS